MKINIVFFLIFWIVFSYINNAYSQTNIVPNEKNLIKNGNLQLGYTAFKSYNINDEQIQVEDIKNFKTCVKDNHGKILYISETVAQFAILYEVEIEVKKFHNYTFSFEFSSLKTHETPEIRTVMNGRQVGSGIELSKNACFWLQSQFEWQSDESEKLKISIIKGDKSSNDVLFDNFVLVDNGAYKNDLDLKISNNFNTKEQKASDEYSYSKPVVQVANENILFDAGSFKIKPYAYPYLHASLNYMRNNPKVCLRLTGFTDNQGNADQNELLALKRAQEVRRFFTGKGILVWRIQCESKGGNESLNDNKTEDERALNRRVAFHFYESDLLFNE